MSRSTLRTMIFSCLFLMLASASQAYFNPGRAGGPQGWHYGEKVLWVRATSENVVKFGVQVGDNTQREIVITGDANAVKNMHAVLLTAYSMEKVVSFFITQVNFRPDGGQYDTYTIGQITF